MATAREKSLSVLDLDATAEAIDLGTRRPSILHAEIDGPCRADDVLPCSWSGTLEELRMHCFEANV